MLAVYRPDSGAAGVGASRGGSFDLDMTGVEGQTRRWVLTDREAWHWDNLALPAGVRFAPMGCSIPSGQPMAAVAHFGPGGLEGRLAGGPFRDMGDALLRMPTGRDLAIRLGPDGTFRAGPQEVLPTGQFLAESVLNDRQQRRQELYRRLLTRPVSGRPTGQPTLLLAWASPAETGFTFGPDTRTVGTALLAFPLRLERSPPGSAVTIPAPLIPCMRALDEGLARPMMALSESADMHLRFQLPRAVLPLKIERARFMTRIDAPGRRVTVAGMEGGKPVEVARFDSPLDPIQVEIAQERLLRPDEDGGLHLNLNLSDVLKEQPGLGGKPLPGDAKWTIEYLELEVSGRTPGE
jgi:hypothetical protein